MSERFDPRGGEDVGNLRPLDTVFFNDVALDPRCIDNHTFYGQRDGVLGYWRDNESVEEE
jgi:hypothetical protein